MPHASAVVLSYQREQHKNLFFKRIILLLSLGCAFLLYLNGKIGDENPWVNYYAVSNSNSFIAVPSPATYAPFSRDDIIKYAKGVVYDAYSFNSQTWQTHLKDFLTSTFINVPQQNEYYKAMQTVGMEKLLKSGMSFAVSKIGDATVKAGVVGGNAVWKVTFPMVLYGSDGTYYRETSGDVSVFVSKVEYIDRPSMLGVFRIQRFNVTDKGSEDGY